MKHLYAPWRSEYSQSVAQTKQEHATQENCTFCIQFKDKDDEEHFILRRFEHCIVMLNVYPYNAGHLLILPDQHVALLPELSKATRSELIELVSHSSTILKELLQAHGINIGLNLGKAAGAGIPSHLHFHVLPRYTGDTNFLPTLADTKQISFDLKAIYKKLKPAFDRLKI
jgi:ATP adenylyltransferase